MATRRSVSKLLRKTYQHYLEDGEASFFETCLNYLWNIHGYGEAVLAEAYTALEQASRECTGQKRMRLYHIEDDHPELLMKVVNRAIDICESRKP